MTDKPTAERIAERLRAQAEYLDTGGPDGEPLPVFTSPPLLREAADEIDRLTAIIEGEGYCGWPI